MGTICSVSMHRPKKGWIIWTETHFYLAFQDVWNTSITVKKAEVDFKSKKKMLELTSGKLLLRAALHDRTFCDDGNVLYLHCPKSKSQV